MLVHAANSEIATANDLGNQLGNGKNACANPAPQHNEACRNLREALARADTRYNWGHAMLGLGAAALVATGAYVFWPTPSPNETREHSRRTGTAVSVGYVPGQATISWLGSF
jgi:hypothetical protein